MKLVIYYLLFSWSFALDLNVLLRMTMARGWESLATELFLLSLCLLTYFFVLLMSIFGVKEIWRTPPKLWRSSSLQMSCTTPATLAGPFLLPCTDKVLGSMWILPWCGGLSHPLFSYPVGNVQILISHTRRYFIFENW